jgi:murein DD-endopeptidase MepM/ murein hydrolase activator NlpD
MRLRILVGCAILPCVLWAVLPVGSTATPTGRIASLESKIQSTQGAIGRKKGTEQVLSTQIAGYTSRINRLQSHISVLQRRQVRVQADLDTKTAELGRIQERLRQERARLARLRARLIVGRRALAGRLVEMYKADKPDMVTVVLNSKGFADLLERSDFIRRISDQDRQVVMVVARAKQDATDTAARLDGLERRQQKVAATILARRDEVAKVKEDLIGTRVGYQQTRAGKAAALAKTRESRQNLEGKLTALKVEEAKVQAALNRSSSSGGGGGGSLPAGPVTRGSGGLIWPVNGPITSPFCERRAWEACHPGIDIGVPSGTPIRAAAAGTVALIQSEASSGGYGNFTCIQHSGSMSTCYAHQSSIGVSMGQSVSQGQVIGISGCTGRCFGPHLHFEVRINGQVTNPMNYL